VVERSGDFALAVSVQLKPRIHTDSHRAAKPQPKHRTTNIQWKNICVFVIESMRAHCLECAGQIKAGDFDILFANSCGSFAVSPIGRYLELPKVSYLQEPRRQLYEAMPVSVWAAPPDKTAAAIPSLIRLSRSTLKVQTLRVQIREEIENCRHYRRIVVIRFSVGRICYGLMALSQKSVTWGLTRNFSARQMSCQKNMSWGSVRRIITKVQTAPSRRWR
jgi:hypothetical protein